MTTRDTIVQAADALFYDHGFAYTSFADIAGAVDMSRGNFYYHFKSKDDILDAVIAERLARTRAMLLQWEADGATPQARISLFVEILLRNQAKIMKNGCPVGTLCTELTKLDHAGQDGANAILNLFRVWLGDQFAQMGRRKDADALALHLLARSQGVATLAQALRDEVFVQREVDQMLAWVNACATPPVRPRR